MKKLKISSNAIKKFLSGDNVVKALLLLVVIVGFMLRMYKFSAPVADWHSFRQVDTASVSREYLKNGIDVLRPRYHDISAIQSGYFNPEGFRFVEFPVFNVLHIFLFKTIPSVSFDEAGRLVSIFSAIGSSIALFVIAKKVAPPLAGVAAAFFYLTIPYNIYFTRVILPEPLAVFLALLSIVLFIKYTDTNKFRWLYASSVIFSLGILVKPPVIFYAGVLAYLSVNKFGWKGTLSRIPHYLALNISLIPVLLWRRWMQDGEFLRGIPFFAWTLNGDGIRFRPAFWNWIFSERIGKLILGTWGMVPFAVGLVSKKSKLGILYAMILGMLVYVSVFATASVRHDYYQIFRIPPIALGMGIGAYEMVFVHKKKLITIPLLIFSIGIAYLVGLIQVKDFYKINHSQMFSAGEAIRNISGENDLIIAPHAGSTTFLYQTQRRGWPVVNESIEEMVERGADYYVSINFADPDVENFKKKYEVAEETSEYIILDLHKPIAQEKI